MLRRLSSESFKVFALLSLAVFSCRPPLADSSDGSSPDAAPADAAVWDLPPSDAGSTGPIIVECAEMPGPTADEHCAVLPSSGSSKRLLLRAGSVLLPDRVLHGGSVLIDEQGKIACAACDCAAAAKDAAQIICPGGVISPGFINTHDHITYTKATPHLHPTNRYDHRHEWRLGVPGDPTRPRLPVSGGNNAQAVQWGELRQLMAGTTSLVGSGQAPGVLRNLDTSNQEGLGQPAVEFDTFPLGDTSGERLYAGCGYPSIRFASSIKGYDAYEPHISEGITTEARNEFLCIDQNANGGQNLLLRKSALIHGIALTAQDACLVAQRGASLIWSPRSNVSLYGHTAQVPMFDRAGVNIALGTDWTASGSMNLLRELKCADEFNRQRWAGYFSAEALWRMATINAALATATNDVIGQIQNGYIADLAIFDASRKAALDHAAVVQAGVEDVLLVLRGGLPMYGDANLMEGLLAGIANKCESLSVCGSEKRLCVERETGKNLADLEKAAGKPIYRLFACGTPAEEPTCVPLRLGQYDGQTTDEDLDGDGLIGAADNCPTVFNPIRPLDRGVQADSDGDGLGDACDPCPLDAYAQNCAKVRAADCDADGSPDDIDNCLGVANPDQWDSDADGQGDACDICPFFANSNSGPCPFTVRDLRDPTHGMRPPEGTKVKLNRLLIVGLHSQSSIGFHARDLDGPPDYSGILVYIGGTTPPKAADGTLLQVGHVVSLNGTFRVFNSQDEIERPLSIAISDLVPVEPLDIKTRDLIGGKANAAERLENLLVRVKNVTMRRLVAPTGDDDFFVSDDPLETCQASAPACARVGDFILDGGKANGQPAFTAGGVLPWVVGVVSGYNNQYSIEVRDLSDIVSER